MSKLHKKLPRLSFKHLISNFPEGLEETYYDDFFNISLPVVRVAILLGITLYALFGILDIWVTPIHKQIIWLIRYAFVCPFLIIVLVLSFFSFFKKYMQILLSASGILLGVGIVIMIGITSESELGFKFYYAGLMLVIMWVYALARIRFIYATITSWLIVISYEIVAIAVNKMLGSPEYITVFVNNNFFFISANVIGMFASFTIEWYMRKNFLLRMEIEKSYTINKKYMDNIKEGLLLIDESYFILNQYSEFMKILFEREDIEGKNFVDFIYQDEETCLVERQELKKFLNFLFHNKSADLEMIMSINPFRNKKIFMQSNEFVSKEIIVNADFIRIYEQDHVEYIMVIFEDITDIVKYEKQLEDQKTRYQQDVESISAILKSGPAIFADFIEESSQILNDIRPKLKNLNDPPILNHVFRQMHSLKGSAKHLELHRISTISHKVEDILVTARDNPETKSIDFENQIEEMIVEIFREFQSLGKMIERLKIFSTLKLGEKPKEFKGALGEFLASLPAMVDALAKDLNKQATLKIENSLDELPFLSKVKNPIIHLIRNSADHGIEDQFERLSKNKSASGKIILRLYDSDSSYYIEVEDDGHGINFELIRKKAIEKNLISEDISAASKSKLLQLIFTPSFSSKENATEISGRGYGLDIVKDITEQLNGKIHINTKIDKGTKITMVIPH